MILERRRGDSPIRGLRHGAVGSTPARSTICTSACAESPIARSFRAAIAARTYDLGSRAATLMQTDGLKPDVCRKVRPVISLGELRSEKAVWCVATNPGSATWVQKRGVSHARRRLDARTTNPAVPGIAEARRNLK